MNILLLASPRTKSSAFGNLLSRRNNANYHSEPFSLVSSTSDTKSILTLLQKFGERLKSTQNNVVKIQPSNLGGMSHYIEHFQLNVFDVIYLLERQDFFDQACSIQVAQQEYYWNNNNNHVFVYSPEKKNQYVLHKDLFNLLIFDIAEYLKIKKFFNTQHIPYSLEKYETLPDKIKIRNVPTGYIYKNIITNYHLKHEVNKCFSTYFDYDTCTADVAGFKKAFDLIDFYIPNNIQ